MFAKVQTWSPSDVFMYPVWLWDVINSHFFCGGCDSLLRCILEAASDALLRHKARVTRDANPGEAANRASNVTSDGQTVEKKARKPMKYP